MPIYHLDSNFAIAVQEGSYDLIRKATIEAGKFTKAENIGKEKQTVLRYYSNLHQALEGYAEFAAGVAQEGDENNQGVNDLLRVLEEVKTAICAAPWRIGGPVIHPAITREAEAAKRKAQAEKERQEAGGNAPYVTSTLAVPVKFPVPTTAPAATCAEERKAQNEVPVTSHIDCAPASKISAKPVPKPAPKPGASPAAVVVKPMPKPKPAPKK